MLSLWSGAHVRDSIPLIRIVCMQQCACPLPHAVLFVFVGEDNQLNKMNRYLQRTLFGNALAPTEDKFDSCIGTLKRISAS
jgi:hypothetical protein